MHRAFVILLSWALVASCALLSPGCGDPSDGDTAPGNKGRDGLAKRLARAVTTRDVAVYEAIVHEAHRAGSADPVALEQLERALVNEIHAGVQWPDPPGLHPTAPILVRLGSQGLLALLSAYEPALNRRPVRMFNGSYFRWNDASGEDPYGFLTLGWREAESLLGLIRDRTNSPGLRYGAGEVLSYAPDSVSVLAMVPLLEMMSEFGDDSAETSDPRSDTSIGHWCLSRIITTQSDASLAGVLDVVNGNPERQLTWLILHNGLLRRIEHPVARPMIEQLRRRLLTPYSDARVGAAMLLADADVVDEQVLATLRRATRTGDQVCRMWAAAGLIAVEGDSDDLLAILLRGLQDQRMRATAEELILRCVASRESAKLRLELMVARDMEWRPLRHDVIRLLHESDD